MFLQVSFLSRANLAAAIGLLALAGCTGPGETDLLESVSALTHETPRQFPVHGIDVSKYQGTIDWKAAKRAEKKETTTPNAETIKQWNRVVCFIWTRPVFSVVDPDQRSVSPVPSSAHRGNPLQGDQPSIVSTETPTVTTFV